MSPPLARSIARPRGGAGIAYPAYPLIGAASRAGVAAWPSYPELSAAPPLPGVRRAGRGALRLVVLLQEGDLVPRRARPRGGRGGGRPQAPKRGRKAPPGLGPRRADFRRGKPPEGGRR